MDTSLLWIGERPAPGGALEHVQAHIEAAFAVRPRILACGERPAETLDARRQQHRSGVILRWLTGQVPEGRVLAVTDVDLFIPVLTFVFGEAQLGGRAAVVSTARLHAAEAPRDARVLLERLAKEAVHELGHVLGLVHCAKAACSMSRSASVRDLDRKGNLLCRDCRTRLLELS
jgi:archaemetzincin